MESLPCQTTVKLGEELSVWCFLGTMMQLLCVWHYTPNGISIQIMQKCLGWSALWCCKSGIPFLRMKLLGENMPIATREILFKFVFKFQDQHRLLHSRLARDRTVGSGHSFSLSDLKCAIPNVLSFLVEKAGNSQANVRKNESKGKPWFCLGEITEESRKTPENPAAPSAAFSAMGFCTQGSKLGSRWSSRTDNTW